MTFIPSFLVRFYEDDHPNNFFPDAATLSNSCPYDLNYFS